MRSTSVRHSPARAPAQSVMILLFILVFAALAFSPEQLLSRRPDQAVADHAALLSPATRSALENLARVVNEKVGASIVTVTMPSLGAFTIEDFAVRLFEAWGIGRRGDDQGILLLFAVQERLVRIETGYGAEGYLPDVTAASLIREAGDRYLSQGRWDDGVAFLATSVAAAAARHHRIDPEELAVAFSRPVSAHVSRPSPPGIVQLLLLLLLIIFLIGTPMGRAMLPWLLLMALSSGRSSGGFGGGGGGGFGGFGGGRSGGGGATGRF